VKNIGKANGKFVTYEQFKRKQQDLAIAGLSIAYQTRQDSNINNL